MLEAELQSRKAQHDAQLKQEWDRLREEKERVQKLSQQRSQHQQRHHYQIATSSEDDYSPRLKHRSTGNPDAIRSHNYLPRTDMKKLERIFDIFPDLLGAGNFADVRRAINRESGQEQALKFIKKSKVQDRLHVDNEIGIMQRCNHQNIIRLYQFFELPKSFCLVLEYVNGGDLFDAIREAKRFTEVDAGKIIKDVVAALVFLHDRQ
ncbi:Oidioi.mRNA.OKI2018_I69.chr1.g2988.t1.cds [Oikopleura dioica]|uniref:Oidioi.mRNA.OKI2018_I69.chr1.g2988.t1.cds n=1 Tax=Oikopleura dioica TaxID=34765 RepID=A0ABN7SY32_OIKDI|nr:Oidioi.mRNA.OKI2018_I69.chr1.g2988.t1.cds [Oikopleura dioica]